VRGTPRTPRGRAALGAISVGGGVLLVAAVTAAAGGQPSGITNTIIEPGDGTTTTITVDTVPPPPPPRLVPLEITKTAIPRYTRVDVWDIDKWASPQAGWDRKDRSVAVDYTVKVTRSWRAERIHVVGKIVVRNPNRVPFLLQVGDDLPGAECRVEDTLNRVTAAGDQESPMLPVIGPGEELGFEYICRLESLPKKTLHNTAWVKFAPALKPIPVEEVQIQGSTVIAPTWKTAYSDKVPVDFTKADYRELRVPVRVTDTLDGDETKVLHPALEDSKTFRYKKYLSFWRGKNQCRTWHNTARITPAPRGEEPVVVEAQQIELPVIERPDWSKTDEAWVKICPPPPAPKGEAPKPPVVEVSPGADSKKPPVVDAKPVDNPKGDVVKDAKPKGKLKIWKATRTRTAQVGDVVTWQITVKNVGKAELSGIKVIDLLPRGLRPVSDEASRRTAVTLLSDLVLEPGESERITVATEVAGRPAPPPVAVTRKMTSKQRGEVIRRARRGIICNVVVAKVRNAEDVRDAACIRIVRGETPQPD